MYKILLFIVKLYIYGPMLQWCLPSNTFFFYEVLFIHFVDFIFVLHEFFFFSIVQHNTISFLKESYLYIIKQLHPAQYILHTSTKSLQNILSFLNSSISIFTNWPLTINTNNVVTFISMLWYVLLGCNAGRIDTCVMYNYDVTYAVLQQS